MQFVRLLTLTLLVASHFVSSKHLQHKEVARLLQMYHPFLKDERLTKSMKSLLYGTERWKLEMLDTSTSETSAKEEVDLQGLDTTNTTESMEWYILSGGQTTQSKRGKKNRKKTTTKKTTTVETTVPPVL
ncbi:uncharacterized protein LOC116173300 [Photinus pyralis]|uniref:uncharacterized protein LOC116173300 n=1 Tax=Photinus pyralis TaxID=7054 RepID=UPI00126754DB|nr:uncharacterized protein LOC116173300 [Photinus pyralis]